MVTVKHKSSMQNEYCTSPKGTVKWKNFKFLLKNWLFPFQARVQWIMAGQEPERWSQDASASRDPGCSYFHTFTLLLRCWSHFHFFTLSHFDSQAGPRDPLKTSGIMRSSSSTNTGLFSSFKIIDLIMMKTMMMLVTFDWAFSFLCSQVQWIRN